VNTTDVTDATIDAIVSAVSTNASTYFAELGDVPDLRNVKKGTPNPEKWRSSEVYVFPERAERVSRHERRIEVSLVYFLKDSDPSRLGMRIGRGADALSDLMEDNFSVGALNMDFDYGMRDGGSEAAAVISAELFV
jgi:hypothetical protein